MGDTPKSGKGRLFLVDPEDPTEIVVVIQGKTGLGRILETECRRQGIDGQGLAARMGVSPSRVYDLWNEKVNDPRIRTVAGALKALGRDLAWAVRQGYDPLA